MRRIRAFVDHPLAGDSEILLPAGPAHHLLRVLRLRPGARIYLFDGSGKEYPAEILAAARRGECRVRLDPPTRPAVESGLQISLVQAVGRGDRMDWSIQKATELGVARIQPIFTERTEVHLPGERAEKRRQHWQQVAIAAAEQSGRVLVPRVERPQDLAGLSIDVACKLFLDPQGQTSLSALQPPCGPHCALLIGPEGGLSQAETATLRQQGFTGVRLGPRVMRTETAGPVAIAILQAHFGDLQ